MRKLTVFNHVTLDGFFADGDGDMSFAHKSPDDAEWNAFVEGNARSGGVLVFGRVTYDMMASWWPTPTAIKSFPAVAERMNNLPKIVFSRTLDKASWSNTTLLKGSPAAEIRRLKKEPGEGMTILGSGSIVSQLADEGLIDEFHVVVNPVALGKGKSMFDGLKKKLTLRLTNTRTFGCGSVLLSYAPAR